MLCAFQGTRQVKREREDGGASSSNILCIDLTRDQVCACVFLCMCMYLYVCVQIAGHKDLMSLASKFSGSWLSL
jgi:hypothetical protein